MDHFSNANAISVKSEIEIDGQGDELDHFPLKERMRILLSSRPFGHLDLKKVLPSSAIKDEAPSVTQDVSMGSSAHVMNTIPSFCSAGDEYNGYHSVDAKFSEECCTDKVIKRSDTEVLTTGTTVNSGTDTPCASNAISCQIKNTSSNCTLRKALANGQISSYEVPCPEVEGHVFGLQEVDVNDHNLLRSSTLSSFPVKVKVGNSGNSLTNLCEDGRGSLSYADMPAVKVKTEIQDESDFDELDHISLLLRQKMLPSISCASLSNFSNLKCSRKSGPDALNCDCYSSLNSKASSITSAREKNSTLMCCLESVYGEYSSGFLQSSEKVETESPPIDSRFSVEESNAGNDPDPNAAKLFRTSILYFPNNAIRGCSYTVSQCSLKTSESHDNVSFRPSNTQEGKENDLACSSLISPLEVEASIVGPKPVNASNEQLVSAISNFPIAVKVETLENGLLSPCDDALGSFSKGDIPAVKVEKNILDDIYVDEVDHIPLQDRIKMLASSKFSNLDYSRDLNCSKQPVACAFEHEVIDSIKVKEQGIPLRRKRKKTVTDSLETALEEDAPGLLQVLTEKGINIDEIKLYGEMENEDALDVSSIEESFSELETVFSKLFSQRTSLLKLAPARHTKGSRIDYCLACLVSLIEQTRYLRFRKWPVEWGWCRDLQSFIFVFERHNRIVLERPEYGYATYFFELVESLPIDWQIKRLVTAMKLTSCSRTTLIENRSLLVGEDLTEGEARVLVEYGWRPNGSLGSMLNYCDRVVHDRKNESDYSEWRSKIRRLLMNGYDGGIIVMANPPKKVIEYKSNRGPQIKLEI